jgi:hypothetical protein
MTREFVIFFSIIWFVSGLLYLLSLRRRVKDLVIEIQDTHFKLLEEINSEKDKSKKLAADLERAEKLATLHMSKNAEFEKQSREAWDMYKKAGLSAGSAQSWLLRELERAVALINKYRTEKGESPIEVNAKLKELLSNFKKEHTPEDL